MSTAQQTPTNVTEVASQLRVVVGKLRRRMNQGNAIGDFTPSQISVLSRLEAGGPATVTALAHAEGVRPQSMGTKLAALNKAGLLSSEADPTDGRATLWRLSEQATETVREVRAAKEDWLLRSIGANFTATEQQELARGVALLARLADS